MISSSRRLIFSFRAADITSVVNADLNDREIRKALIHKLRSQPSSPKEVIEELRVHNGNAIADVVALDTEAHCYEIKGCNDKIERIIVQGSYYNACFRRITLVTTEHSLPKALKIIPPFWGIMVACVHNNEVRLDNVKNARNNPSFSKHIALLTLWKSEMLSLIDDQQHHRKPREILAQLIAAAKGKIELSAQICDLLLDRHRAMHSGRPAQDHVGNMRIHRRLDSGGRSTVAA